MMRLLKRLVQIVTRKDIDWLELIVAYITLVFCLVLLAPGDYFADSPRLHSLQHPFHGLYLPELFWLIVFGGMGLVQWVAIAVGENAVTVQITRSYKIVINPFIIRMRVLALNTGVWASILTLAWPSSLHWHGLPVSIAIGLFFGMALFSLAGAIRMAAEVIRNRNLERQQEVMQEAEKLAALFREVDQLGTRAKAG